MTYFSFPIESLPGLAKYASVWPPQGPALHFPLLTTHDPTPRCGSFFPFGVVPLFMSYSPSGTQIFGRAVFRPLPVPCQRSAAVLSLFSLPLAHRPRNPGLVSLPAAYFPFVQLCHQQRGPSLKNDGLFLPPRPRKLLFFSLDPFYGNRLTRFGFCPPLVEVITTTRSDVSLCLAPFLLPNLSFLLPDLCFSSRSIGPSLWLPSPSVLALLTAYPLVAVLPTGTPNCCPGTVPGGWAPCLPETTVFPFLSYTFLADAELGAMHFFSISLPQDVHHPPPSEAAPSFFFSSFFKVYAIVRMFDPCFPDGENFSFFVTTLTGRDGAHDPCLLDAPSTRRSGLLLACL